MKKQLLLLIAILSHQLSTSQCARAATNFGNNTTPNYDISGDVSVTLNSNNTVTLNLGSNFNTAAGPDLRAYLVNPKTVSDNNLKTTPITSSSIEAIEFGLVTNVNGASNFTVNIPNTVNIFTFNKVVFYCLQFNAFWDFGTYTPFTNGTCTLSLDENDSFSKISIFPNPANNFIKLSNSNELAQIKIHDILGKIVYQVTKPLNENINLTNIKSGIYILSATTIKGTISKKFAIK